MHGYLPKWAISLHGPAAKDTADVRRAKRLSLPGLQQLMRPLQGALSFCVDVQAVAWHGGLFLFF